MRIPHPLRRRGDLGDEGEQSRRGFATTLALLVVSLGIACVTQVGGNVELEKRSAAYTLFWPQGWTFFTDLGTKAVLSAYRTDPAGDRFIPESQRQDWSDRQWGLNRSAEAQSWEITKLGGQIPQAAWRRCDAATVDGCKPLFAHSAPYAMTNWSSSPSLCGLTVITVEHPNYPVGRTLPPSPRRIYAVAEVDITCPR